jgi:hypothetical protein
MIPNPASIPPPPPLPAGARPIPPPAPTFAPAPSEPAPSAPSTAATQELLRQSKEAKDSALALLGNVQSVVGLAEQAVREQMQARPYLTMGAAAGAGYVLAGGLASSLTRQLVKAGAKAATAYLAGMVLKKVTEAASEGLPDGE